MDVFNEIKKITSNMHVIQAHAMSSISLKAASDNITTTIKVLEKVLQSEALTETLTQDQIIDMGLVASRARHTLESLTMVRDKLASIKIDHYKPEGLTVIDINLGRPEK